MTLLKKILKSILGDYYYHLLRIYHYSPAHCVLNIPFLKDQTRRQKKNGAFFPFDITGAMGMGGALIHVLKLLQYADKKDLTPVCRLTGPLYADKEGEDWFPTYFTMKDVRCDTSSQDQSLHFHPVVTREDYRMFLASDDISIGRMHELWTRYIDIQPWLTNMAKDFDGPSGAAAQTEKMPSLGIHYRGTDKRAEAQSPDWNEIVRMAEQFFEKFGMPHNIFLATDDPDFAAFIRQKFPAIDFMMFEMQAGEGRTPRHFSSMTGSQKAIEALVNSIALSRRTHCIRTVSYLSAWSKIFNPDLRVYTINKPYGRIGHFPETAIWEERNNFLT